MRNLNYTIINIFPIGNNCSVTIEGSGTGLKNGMTVYDDENIAHQVLSVAMVNEREKNSIGETTTVLIKGLINSENIHV